MPQLPILRQSSSDEDDKYGSLNYSPLSTTSYVSCSIRHSEDSDSRVELSPADTSGSSIVAALELESPTTPDQQEEFSSSQGMYGYKLVGDNVDKNVRPTFQRNENKGQSLHHFHAYGVKDRVPTASLSDAAPAGCTPNPKALLPSPEDAKCLKEEMVILLSRYCFKIIPEFCTL